MERIYKQPSRGKRERDDGMYEPDGNPLRPSDSRRPSKIVKHTEDIIGEIDDILDEPDAAESTREPGTASPAELDEQEEKGFYTGDESSGQASPEGLETAESSPGIPAPDAVGKGYTANSKTEAKPRKFSIKSLTKKRMLMIFLVGTPLSGAIIGGLLLLIFASSLKVPNLGQDILTLEFARITRQFSHTAEKGGEESLAVESVNDGLYNDLKVKYSSLRDGTWGKLDKFRPAQVQKKLQRTNGLKFNESEPNLLGRTTLKNITLNGKTYAINRTDGYGRFIPGFSQYSQFKNDVAFSRDFAPSLIDTMAANDVGPLVRGAVARNIRREINVSLVAWLVGRYIGKTPDEARLQINRDTYRAINDPKAPSSVVDQLEKAESDVQKTVDEDVNNDKTLADIIDNGGVDQNAEKVVESDLKSISGGVITDTLKATNTAYAVALPLCILYDGSLEKAGPAIDAQTTEQQRAFYFVESAGSQQYTGSVDPSDPSGSGLATAINATDDKLGDISQSNAYIQSAGGVPDTTATSFPAEASPTLQYSLFNLMPGFTKSGIADALEKAATPSCKAVTNIWAAVGVAVIQQIGTKIADIFTGGGADVALEGGEIAVNETVDNSVSAIINRLTSQLTGKLANTFSKDALKSGVSGVAAKVRATVGIKAIKKETPKIAGLSAVTVLAKMLVAAKAGQYYNGLEQGSDFANEAQAGGDVHANELERTQLFGRPLNKDEICESDRLDVAFNNQTVSRQSAGQRYLALSNANSLLSRTATGMSVALSGSFPAAMSRISGYALKPFDLMESLSSVFFAKASAAAECSTSFSHYGNVQFGWSDAEEKLLDSNDSYFPLENMLLLEQELHQKGVTEGAIASKYAKCFGYDFTGTTDSDEGQIFDPTDSASALRLDLNSGSGNSLGDLLSNGDIQRDADGNVSDTKGDCSPVSLGVNNPDYGDLVFRWRLAMRYDTTLDQETALQSIGTVST